MSDSGSRQEIEIKLRVRDAEQGRALVEAAGGSLVRERTFESNILFDTPDKFLRRKGQLIRLREYGADHVVTFKGRGSEGRHKIREEIEFEVSDAKNVGLILEHLGYYPSFHYEKYRTEFEIAGEAGKVLLDETPIGVFLELEGRPEWIDRTARRMGFVEADYITASYGALYVEDCLKRGQVPADMLFNRGCG
ncbi:MAG: class IV adenylate cyclase [Acidobacteria bacterium]|nr:class IV adenylate cyclase [Acidobacteriota bacterium]